MQAQETQIPHAKVAISLLTAAHELIKGSGQQSTRLLHHLGALMAREHLAAEDVGNAARLLESVAGQHGITAMAPAHKFCCPGQATSKYLRNSSTGWAKVHVYRYYCSCHCKVQGTTWNLCIGF